MTGTFIVQNNPQIGNEGDDTRDDDYGVEGQPKHILQQKQTHVHSYKILQRLHNSDLITDD